jgi:hypothetical protein
MRYGRYERYRRVELRGHGRGGAEQAGARSAIPPVEPMKRDGAAESHKPAAGAIPGSGDQLMWRALALSIGIFLMILGVECLGVETFHLKLREDPPPNTSPQYFSEFLSDAQPEAGPKKTYTPPSWLPWSLLATGAVTCLYSFTLPRHIHGG